MEAKELRIGNFIHANLYGKDFIKVESICSINNEIFNLKTGEIPLESINPIPLTEEILFKCKDEFTTDFSLLFKNNRLHILFCEKWLLVCDYLHEYQNAHYILTGEEINVKL